MKRALQGIGLVCLMTFAAAYAHAEEAAKKWHPRVLAVNAILDELPNGDSESGFIARLYRVEDGGTGTFVLENPARAQFSAREDRYLSYAFVDSKGFLVVMQLNMGHGVGFLKGGGIVQESPPPKSKFMETHAPLGWERVYFVATRNPVDQRVFESALNTGGDGSTVFKLGDRSMKLAKNYVAAVLANNSPSEISTVAIDSFIAERKYGPRYNSKEIAGVYRKRGSRWTTGSILDSRIRFEPNSAVLSEEAQSELYPWGEALMNPKMAGYKFHIVGYTDDKESNPKLAKERAEAALNYLMSNFDIDEERLTAVGDSANTPVAENTDDEGGAANRRVEFMQVFD